MKIKILKVQDLPEERVRQWLGKVRESEGYYVLVKEPDDIYVDHLSPDSGSAHNIADELITLLND